MAGTLIRGRYVLTAVDETPLEDAAVRVVGETIDAVGGFAELRAAHPDDVVLGGANDLVTPGFVNTHGHFSEGLTTGIAEETTLWEWFGAVINPVAPNLDAEKAYHGTMLAAAQMLRSGITIANDMFVCDPRPDGPTTPGVVRALDEIGLRGVVSYGSRNVQSGLSPDRIVDEHEALREAAAASRLSSFRVGIAGLGAHTPELLDRTIAYANDGGHGVHIHLQEVREEVTAVRSAHGVTPIGFCAREGMFGAPTVAAHCVWVDHHDRELLAEHGVAVAHNPVANMILASGVCPVPELRRMGIPVGLGVDGPASNDSQDFMQVVKTAVLLQRVHHQQATAMMARDAFAMATTGGARALGMQDRLGALAPGMAADVVVFDGDSPALANIHDPYQAIVYCAGPTEIRDVWVAGTRSVADGALVHVDAAEVAAASRPHAVALARAAELGPLSRLDA